MRGPWRWVDLIEFFFSMLGDGVVIRAEIRYDKDDHVICLGDGRTRKWIN